MRIERMNSNNKTLASMWKVLTMVACTAMLVACSNTDIEQTFKPMAQPLRAVPIKTSSAGNSGLEPETVIDVYGNVTAVWEEYDGTHFNIWTKRRVAGENWSMASLLETDNSGDAYSPQIAVDGIGNAAAVWKQSDGKRFSIYANRYVNGKGWEGAKQIVSGIDTHASAYAPLVTYDATGYAMVAWQEADGLSTKTWVNHHSGDAGWGIAKQLISSTASTHYPRFEIDDHGFLVVTQQRQRKSTAHRNTLKSNHLKQVSITRSTDY